MAWHFVRLKLRLMANGLRSSARVALFVVGIVFGLAFGLGGFGFFAASPSGPSAHAVAPVIGFALLLVGWIVVPLVGFGIDETLDPDRLALLPLRRRTLMVGLVAASSVGIAPAATLIAASGVLVGYETHGAGLVLILVAVLLEFALCIVAARFTVTALARMMRTRRLRDLAGVILTVVGATAGLLAQLPRLLGGTLNSHAATALASVLRWTPPGLAGAAVVHAEDSRLGLAVLELAAAAAALGTLMWLWSRNLARMLTTAPESGPPRRRGRGRKASPASLFPRAVKFLPRNRIGVVAAKELRYLSREPLARGQRIVTAMLAVGSVVAVALVPNLHRQETVLGSAFLLWWFNMTAINQFAIDRAAYWMNVVAAGDPASDLFGKNLAAVLVHVPVFVAVAIGTAAITGGWVYLPSAACLAVATLGMQLGVGNVVSVRSAQPAPEGSNPWAIRSGQGLSAGFLLMGAFLGSLLLLAPVAVLVGIALTMWRPLLWIASPVAVLYGAGAYLVGVRVAAKWLREHQPELLEALSPRSAA
jgi:ABC-2 type transport system permease protein